MILTLAWRSLAAHPVRAAVLGVGFGLGVGVMATLLGVGEVVLDQARAPALAGGGQLVISGVTGPVTSARFVVETLQRLQRTDAGARFGRVVASPRKRADLYLVRNGTVVPVRARGSIPSLDRALGDPETASVTAWTDTAADRSWSAPTSGDVLRAMDRFHVVPNVPARASSWWEWLYFRGQSGATPDGVRFYLAFLAGPKGADGRRPLSVRLQLDRGGRMTTYAEWQVVDEGALASAPDLTVGRSQVRLAGERYHITIDLPMVARGDAIGAPGQLVTARSAPQGRINGEILLDAIAGRAVPPMVLRGAGGWVSGYTVPVMSGALSGWLEIDGVRTTLDGSGYHDHNWGFWEGVSWRWGQVQHEGLSYVYGRIFPPPEAADPERVPGVLIALGPDGPVGYATRVSIEEVDDPVTGRPQRIVVQGRSGSLDLTLELEVEGTVVNRGGVLAGGPDFLQLRARYHVSGRAGDRSVDFTADGAAETFRGR